MYVRTKRVTLDGADFIIASLSVEQVETIVTAPLSQEEEALPSPYEDRVYRTICASLNSGAGGGSANGNGELWDTKRLKSILDALTIKFLYDEILAFGGLKVKESAAGESSAAAPATA